MPNGEGGTRWKVVGQRQTMALIDDGSIGQVVEVTFTLNDGTTGRVTLPVRGYNAAAVSDAINAYADHLAAVAKLEG